MYVLRDVLMSYDAIRGFEINMRLYTYLHTNGNYIIIQIISVHLGHASFISLTMCWKKESSSVLVLEKDIDI